MQNQNVVEHVQYRLQEGRSEPEFLRLNEKLNQWVMEQPGFLYRSLNKTEDGKWCDIVYWQNMAMAQAAAAAFPTIPACQAMMPFIAEESLSVTHFHVMLEAGHAEEPML